MVEWGARFWRPVGLLGGDGIQIEEPTRLAFPEMGVVPA